MQSNFWNGMQAEKPAETKPGLGSLFEMGGMNAHMLSGTEGGFGGLLNSLVQMVDDFLPGLGLGSMLSGFMMNMAMDFAPPSIQKLAKDHPELADAVMKDPAAMNGAMDLAGNKRAMDNMQKLMDNPKLGGMADSPEFIGMVTDVLGDKTKLESVEKLLVDKQAMEGLTTLLTSDAVQKQLEDPDSKFGNTLQNIVDNPAAMEGMRQLLKDPDAVDGMVSIMENEELLAKIQAQPGGLEAVLSDPAKVEELKDELDSPLIGLAKWMPDSVVDWKLNSMFAKDEEKPEAPEVSAPEDKPTYSMPSLGT